MATDRPALLVRSRDPSGRTVMFSTRHGGRTGRSPLQFFDPGQVPAFDGPEAWFAVERVRGGSRIVKVLHPVAPPAWAESDRRAQPAAHPYVPWGTPASNR